MGRATFELASAVDEAIGIDYSSAFINVCNTLKNKGSVDYSMISEGDLCTEHKAVVPADIVSIYLFVGYFLYCLEKGRGAGKMMNTHLMHHMHFYTTYCFFMSRTCYF